MKAQTNLEKKYIMINKENGARIRCAEKYVTSWLARGFKVEGIRYNGASNPTDTIEREIQLIVGRNADNYNRI